MGWNHQLENFVNHRFWGVEMAPQWRQSWRTSDEKAKVLEDEQNLQDDRHRTHQMERYGCFQQ